MRYRRPIRAIALFAALGLSAGLAACSSGGGAGGDSGPRRSANLITAEEMTDYGAETVLTVIRRLRPRWLQPRGASASGANMPIAFLDGARLGFPDALGGVNVADIESVRFLNASDATMRYGTNFPGGAIEVRSRTR